MPVRSFVAWCATAGSPAGSVPAALSAAEWRSRQRGALRVYYLPRFAEPAGTSAPAATLLLGAGGDWDGDGTTLAHGATIRIDDRTSTLVAHSSIVALPPIFVYRNAAVVAVTSDIYLLAGVSGVTLAFDPLGVTESGRFGHPVEHRTLFRDLTLMPGGSRLTLGPDGVPVVGPVWNLPTAERMDWHQFIDAQIAAFQNAVQRTDLSGSFLSLTAGLDTRTVFAELAAEQRLIPAVTMTGPRRSLDAKIAGRLCRAYGIRHEAVTFDEQFARELPRYVETASRLSGGLESLGQAPEVYLYDRLGGRYAARLSGNLGNQVGRGGTEGVSVRGADLAILAPPLQVDGSRKHWLLSKLQQDERATTQFILQQEIPFTLVGNFGIGNHYAVQQTPYASPALIALLSRRPETSVHTPSGSMLWMRLRDLRHRFLGENAGVSFQRTLVRRHGGAASTIPINWGWRPAGSVSIAGLALGTATLFGMYARSRGLDDGLLRAPLTWTGLPALHDFRETRRWLRISLKEYVLDLFGSRAIRDADLFDWTVLDPIVEEHFRSAADHYHTVTFALDLALAHRTMRP